MASSISSMSCLAVLISMLTPLHSHIILVVEQFPFHGLRKSLCIFVRAQRLLDYHRVLLRTSLVVHIACGQYPNTLTLHDLHQTFGMVSKAKKKPKTRPISKQPMAISHI